MLAFSSGRVDAGKIKGVVDCRRFFGRTCLVSLFFRRARRRRRNSRSILRLKVGLFRCDDRRVEKFRRAAVASVIPGQGVQQSDILRFCQSGLPTLAGEGGAGASRVCFQEVSTFLEPVG